MSTLDNLVIELFLNLRTDLLTIIMKIFSFIGSFWGISIIILIFLYFEKTKLRTVLLKHTIIITIINNVLKYIFKKPRPEFSLVIENSYSFPSGHSMIGTFVFGFLIIYFANKKLKNQKLKKCIIFVLLLCIIFIPISRLYLGVHYFSDVLVGVILGLIYLVALNKYFNLKKI